MSQDVPPSISLNRRCSAAPHGERLNIDYGPGYRVYFVQRGSELVILLAGGDKRTQDQDIQNKALSPTSNPEFATILKVVRALGLQLRVQASNA